MRIYKFIFVVVVSISIFIFKVTPTYAAGPCPLTGDTNTCDGVVNILDYSYLSSKFGSSEPKADLNSDGTVNILDFQIVNQNFGRTGPTPTASSTPTPTRTPTPPSGATPTRTPTPDPSAPPGISVLHPQSGMQIPTDALPIFYDLTGNKTAVKSLKATFSNGQVFTNTLLNGTFWILNGITYGTQALTVELLDVNGTPLPNPEAKKSVSNITFYAGQVQFFPPLVKPSTAQIASGVPLCPATLHDKTKWHPLFIADYGPVINQATGERQGCHFTHEHHDDPHYVDDIFGPPGEWFGMPGQEISYPWQTFVGANDTYPAPPTDPTKLENGFKHEGYKYIVRKNLPCFPADKGKYCFRAFRWQVHALGASPDHVSRFHSYSFEAQVDYNGQLGIFRYGGWTDTGTLHVGATLVEAGKGIGHIPLPADPNPLVFFSATNRTLATADATGTTWYMEPGIHDHFGNADTAIIPEIFGGVNPASPTDLVFKCPDFKCKWNSSRMVALEYNIDFANRPEFNPDANGTMNYSGYFNRHAEIVTNCTSVGLDCIPAIFSSVKQVRYHYLGQGVESEKYRPDYDTSPANLNKGTEWWITYPN